MFILWALDWILWKCRGQGSPYGEGICPMPNTRKSIWNKKKFFKEKDLPNVKHGESNSKKKNWFFLSNQILRNKWKSLWNRNLKKALRAHPSKFHSWSFLTSFGSVNLFLIKTYSDGEGDLGFQNCCKLLKPACLLKLTYFKLVY